EQMARAAQKEALSEAVGGMKMVLPGGPPIPAGAARPLFRALYQWIRRGVNTWVKLSADAEYLKLLREVTGLSAAGRQELEAAFEEVKALAKLGEAKNMDEASVLRFLDRTAINRGKAGFFDKIVEEMKAWKPLSPEQQRALETLGARERALTALRGQKEAALEELNELRALGRKTSDDVAEIKNLERELDELDPHWDPAAKPKQGRGKLADAETALEQAQEGARQAEVSLYDRIRASVPATGARERALKGVTADQIGRLKPRPGALQADHIVSVREVVDMDGFSRLPWKQQKAIVDSPENLIAMDASANASKGSRSWSTWRQAQDFYDASDIEKMVAREAEIRKLLSARIDEAVAALGTPKGPLPP
ncbi:MAG TPA: hypothetical protein VEQ58_14820, partial [Polyangiaceae bacterium]|nr:hypothetical protein [Polyangiaceae bacterium]